MTRKEPNRLLVERPLPRDGQMRSGLAKGARTPRSVTVNMVESPLGWLKSRGLVTQRQFDAGDRLREDWERAQLSPSVTMRWDASPLGSSRQATPRLLDPTQSQLAAKDRFENAVAAVGPGMSDILWRVVCAGEGMREAEQALGWPARAGKLVLGLALDRLADFYRIG
ncbi:MAG TPA: DUF6456 domain-containing protein [Allosphingosinicella sp.]|jgi:hypothetical protein|uniref:DUF6456 domain-containing protein n=1 Tax=Allosphingosinicella sp. TaxID=2823234 RepID=UPI002F28BA3D